MLQREGVVKGVSRCLRAVSEGLKRFYRVSAGLRSSEGSGEMFQGWFQVALHSLPGHL